MEHPPVREDGSRTEERFRVEELARLCDTSVDTVRFYQKRRLLDPPERQGRVALYGRSHVERLGRIRDLQAKGLGLAVIGLILNGEVDDADLSLAAAVARAGAERAGEPSELLSEDQLADRANVPVELIRAVMREKLLVPYAIDGEQRFTEADVHVLASGLDLLSAGIPLPELMELARRHDRAVRDVAEAAVALFDGHVRKPLREAELDPLERAQRLVDAFNQLLPAVTSLVTHHFRRVLLQTAYSHLESVGEPEEIAAAVLEARKLTESA